MRRAHQGVSVVQGDPPALGAGDVLGEASDVLPETGDASAATGTSFRVAPRAEEDRETVGKNKEAVFRMCCRGDLHRVSCVRQLLVGASDDETTEIAALVKKGVVATVWEQSVIDGFNPPRG